MRQSILNGAGMEILDPDFRAVGRLPLGALFEMPPPLRGALLFGTSRMCIPLQKILDRLLGGASPVQTRFIDGPLRGQSFVCWTSEKYFFMGTYFEADVQRLLAQTIQQGDIIYDVGGHAGYMSLLFSALTGPSGKVFTFEPSAVNFPRVQHNVARNGRSNVEILNVAASDHEGVALLSEHGSESAIVASNEIGEGISPIRTVRLDDFVYRDGHPAPKFIKLDVEGHGGAALSGTKRLLESARPTLMCEVHSACEEQQITSIFTAYCYRQSAIDRDRKFPRQMMAYPL